MSWFSKDYQRRQIVGVAIYGGSGSAAQYDIKIDIPKEWDTFWDSIRSDFKDVVVCDPLGAVLTFQRGSSADYANRVLSIEIDAFDSPNNNSMNAIYLYYSNASESVDRSSSFTLGTAKKGYQPIVSFHKSTADQIDVFFMFNSYFGNRIDTYNDRLMLEELNFVQLTAYLSSGSASTALVPDNDYTRLGNGFVRARWIAGDTSTDYAIVATLVSDDLQIIESRAVMRVKNLLPS